MIVPSRANVVRLSLGVRFEAAEQRFLGVDVRGRIGEPVLARLLELLGEGVGRLFVRLGARFELFDALLLRVDLLLEAFARLPEGSRWRLVVAGEAWAGLGEALSAQVEALGLGDRVQLKLGWAPEPEVEQLLSAADVLVLPYRNGTQSAVAPMALSRGLPVLATDVGGLGEVVEDGVSGLLVEPGSPQVLADALMKLESGTLEFLAAGALASSNRWTWAGYAEAIEGLVETLETGATRRTRRVATKRHEKAQKGKKTDTD